MQDQFRRYKSEFKPQDNKYQVTSEVHVSSKSKFPDTDFGYYYIVAWTLKIWPWVKV